MCDYVLPTTTDCCPAFYPIVKLTASIVSNIFQDPRVIEDGPTEGMDEWQPVAASGSIGLSYNLPTLALQ